MLRLLPSSLCVLLAALTLADVAPRVTRSHGFIRPAFHESIFLARRRAEPCGGSRAGRPGVRTQRRAVPVRGEDLCRSGGPGGTACEAHGCREQLFTLNRPSRSPGVPSKAVHCTHGSDGRSSTDFYEIPRRAPIPTRARSGHSVLTVPIPASLQLAWALGYVALPTFPSRVLVRGRAGKVIQRESFGALPKERCNPGASSVMVFHSSARRLRYPIHLAHWDLRRARPPPTIDDPWRSFGQSSLSARPRRCSDSWRTRATTRCGARR